MGKERGGEGKESLHLLQEIRCQETGKFSTPLDIEANLYYAAHSLPIRTLIFLSDPRTIHGSVLTLIYSCYFLLL
jgi:hypothetical protein